MKFWSILQVWKSDSVVGVVIRSTKPGTTMNGVISLPIAVNGWNNGNPAFTIQRLAGGGDDSTWDLWRTTEFTVVGVDRAMPACTARTTTVNRFRLIEDYCRWGGYWCWSKYGRFHMFCFLFWVNVYGQTKSGPRERRWLSDLSIISRVLYYIVATGTVLLIVLLRVSDPFTTTNWATRGLRTDRRYSDLY